MNRTVACCVVAFSVSSVFASRVLVIGVDGCKPDCIALAETPALDRLIREGSYNDNAQAEDLTYSGPNWASILHGVHRDKHGVINNEYRPQNLEAYPDFLTYLERSNPDLVTAKVVAWDPIGKFQPSEADVVEIPEGEDEGVTKIAVEMLSNRYEGMPDGPDALFLHLDEIDGAGHTYGFDTSQPMYLAGITRADAMIGRITNAMRARPDYDAEDWLVIVVSDHGGSIDKGHSGNTPEKRTMPFIVSGRSAVQGGRHFPEPRTCDVPATALTHMGVEIDPEWGMDSRAIGLTKTARPLPVAGDNLIYNGDAETNRGFEAQGIDAYASGWNDPGPAQWTVVRYGSPGVISTSDAGPTDRGMNCFAGGTASTLVLSQEIDLGPLSDVITRGAEATLSGWLGGVGDEPDAARVTAVFYDNAGAEVGRLELMPVTNEDRQGKTGLMPRVDGTPKLPRHAARVVVTLESGEKQGPTCDALADNLSLVIERARPEAR